MCELFWFLFYDKIMELKLCGDFFDRKDDLDIDVLFLLFRF